MLPEGWREVVLAEVTEKVMVGIASAATHAYRGSGVPMLRNLNIRPGRIEDVDLLFIDPEFERSHKGKRLRAGDVLVVRTGYPGVSAVVPARYTGAQCFTSLIVRPRSEVLFAHYFCQFMNSPLGQRLSVGAEAGGAQKNLNAGELERLSLPLPPLAEQKRIAKALGVWDEAISATERLLIKCREQKSALSHSLLSSASRSRRDRTPLTRKPASEIFRPVSVRGNGDLPLLSVMQDVGVVPRDSLDRKVVMPDGSTESYKRVEPGNFVISLRSFEGGLEYSRHRGLVSPAYTVIEPRIPISDDFYRHYFKSSDFIGRLAVAVIGIRDGKQISYDDFAFLRLPAPSLREQQKIADALNAAEATCQVHQRQVERFRLEKRALMADLLTGRRRVRTDGHEVVQ
jgi:type I restriction enzyme S subunit